jgi:hypothetical protein
VKRDMDLVRAILLAGEDTTEAEALDGFLSIEGYDEGTVAGHVELLEEAGFVRAHVVRFDGTGPLQAQVYGLTWAGHEFLDAIRNETVWRKTKETLKDKSLGFASDLVVALATSFAKVQLGLPAG